MNAKTEKGRGGFVRAAGKMREKFIAFVKNHSQKRSIPERVLYGFIFVFFLAIVLTYLYTVIWCFLQACKTHVGASMNPYSLPEEWHFENFAVVFTEMTVNGIGFFGMVTNSLYFAILGSFVNIMGSVMLAYVTTKYKFRGAGFYFAASLIMSILPIYGSGGSAYLLYERLGFIDSPLMLIASFGGMGMNYLYFHSFWESVSWSYAEAAEIDGAGDYSIFFRVMLPQAMPMFGALFLLSWVGNWNAYDSALLYLQRMPTLAAGLYIFRENMGGEAAQHLLWAGCFISCVPPIILFILFNNALMNNVSLGGIKE